MPRAARVTKEEEAKIALMLESGTLQEVAKKMRRSLPTISRVKNRQVLHKPVGRKPEMSRRHVTFLLKHVQRLNEDPFRSKCLAEIMRTWRVKKYSAKQVRLVLKKEGMRWRRAHQGPLLSPKQEKVRLEWCKKYSKKPPSFPSLSKLTNKSTLPFPHPGPS